jgi:hypothetical protein
VECSPAVRQAVKLLLEDRAPAHTPPAAEDSACSPADHRARERHRCPDDPLGPHTDPGSGGMSQRDDPCARQALNPAHSPSTPR